ncbi:MAG: hypothetical protein KTR28_09340 [Micavibrio sp.]|nr:hypothetical protein [Micavibrio sp.]
MLQDKDMAALTNRLVVPAAMQDCLDTKTLDNDARYALHEILSEQQPDTALLSIASCAKQIGTRFEDAHPSMAVLQYECADMLERYGNLWLKNARRQPFDTHEAQQQLLNTPEDLEQLSTLLENASYFLQDIDTTAAELCRILMVQADAQLLIAETYAEIILIDRLASINPASNDTKNTLSHLDNLSLENYKDIRENSGFVVGEGSVTGVLASQTNNVIKFPGTHYNA